MQGKLSGLRQVVGIVAVGLLLLTVAGAAPAAAESPWWEFRSTDIPARLAPGGSGTVLLSLSDIGDAGIDGTASPVTISDTLPPGLTATAIVGHSGPFHIFSADGPVECTLATLTCTFAGTLAAFEGLVVEISVEVAASAQQGLENEASVSGGGAPATTVKRPVAVGDTPISFGVEDYKMTAENADGSPDTQAGSHPFQLTTTLALDETSGRNLQDEMPKDLHFQLPPGLVGNPTPFPRCSEANFNLLIGGAENPCPSDTVVGVAVVTVYTNDLGGRYTRPVPVFNLVPRTGEPARFGFEFTGDPVILDTSLRTGGDYGVTVSVNNLTQIAAFLVSQVTLWGVPGDPRHNQSRGWQCVYAELGKGSNCATPIGLPSAPLLTLPTSCEAPPLTTIEADSWTHPGVFDDKQYAFQDGDGNSLKLDGCNRLPFDPSLSVAPDGQAGSTPTGLTVGIHVPQETILDPQGLAESNLQDTTVALPAGVQLSPAAADGLLSCSLGQIGMETADSPTCPDAAKVGTVELTTPLLSHALEGAVYLAAQDANPFGGLVAMYIVVEDPQDGVLIKLAGEVKLDASSGQITAVFRNSPQLPFEDLKLHFFGSARAPLTTPPLCGSYTTQASFSPWSGNSPTEPSSTFQIASGPNGSPCASPRPFTPGFEAGSTNLQAGAFTPFALTMSRPDADQTLAGLSVQLPAGLSGDLSKVQLCPEPQASTGACPAGSLIGHTVVSAGLGNAPFTVEGGQVFITGPYKGAPFGLSILNPAKAGPFDLGFVVVRAKVEVDPTTAALHIVSDPLPTIKDGIPLQIQHVNVTVDRPEFTFNPTDCNPAGITGTMTSTEGASASVQTPFQVTNCASLAFKPGFSASTSGRPSRANGASLAVKLTYPSGAAGTLANIARVKVELPKQLPSRLTTLQKACTEAVFDANPESCPAASRVGEAVASTPILAGGLAGPAYFVSHGGAKFPELVVVLKGEDGVTVDLHGETFISKKGITSSTFAQVPDVPVGSFELKLPQGPYSALAANGNLCKSKLTMPTEFVAQNGAVIHQRTKIAVTGCPKAKRAAHRKKQARRPAKQHRRPAQRGGKSGMDVRGSVRSRARG